MTICTALDKSSLSRPGSSTKLRIWVEGGPRPILLRLHNDSPGVVRLKGDDDQIIHLGCSLHRRARRKVTLIGPGEPQLVVRPYSAAYPKQEAAVIAATLAPRLAQIEAEFNEGRAKLSPEYRAEAVSELLDTTEAELKAALSYQELAALRSYVQEQFRQARKDLETSPPRNATRDSLFHPRAVLASLALPLLLEDTKAQTAVEAAPERIGKMLSRLTRMADKNDLTTSLCVTSEPGTRAKFLMRPQGIRGWTVETLTVGDLAVVYRGLYAYSMSKGLRRKHCEKPDRQQCALIDLVDNPLPIFHCDLTADACTRNPGPPSPPCKNHGQ